MKFRTASGTAYSLKNIVKEEGSEMYSADLQRLSDAGLIHVDHGHEMENNDEYHKAYFHKLPVVGRSFSFMHSKWNGCFTTPITDLSLADDE